jgi:hypothetical protein
MKLQGNIFINIVILLTCMELQRKILYKYFNSAHLHGVAEEYFYKYCNSAHLHGVAEENFDKYFNSAHLHGVAGEHFVQIF